MKSNQATDSISENSAFIVSVVTHERTPTHRDFDRYEFWHSVFVYRGIG